VGSGAGHAVILAYAAAQIHTALVVPNGIASDVIQPDVIEFSALVDIASRQQARVAKVAGEGRADAGLAFDL
jgi:hypothetical protein